MAYFLIYLNMLLHGFSCHVNLKVVKNIAKLTIFFSITFIIIFMAAMFFKFLSLRVDWARILPPRPETTQTLMVSAAHWALSLSLFSSILLTMNYIVRRKFNPFSSIICVMSLSFVFCFGISFSLEQWKLIPAAQGKAVPLGGKGLILSNSTLGNETSVVLLNGAADSLGPRVTAMPSQSMVYQYYSGGAFELPPVPFGDDTPWFLRVLSMDIKQNSDVFQNRFNNGLFSYVFFVGSLIFLLCSLGYAIKFSVWPLANLFLVTIAFRGILSLNSFVNSMEMQSVIESFIGSREPILFALPAFFLCFGMIVHVYSFLVYAAKRRYADDY